MLVDVFAPEFRNPKNMHLRNFFVILPPLVRELFNREATLLHPIFKSNILLKILLKIFYLQMIVSIILICFQID